MKQFAAVNIFILLFLSFSFTGCSKKRTYDIKLHIQSETNGAPVANAKVQLAYFKDKDGESDMQTVDLGMTDADGNISATDKIHGKSYNHTIRVFAEGYGKRISENLAYKLPVEIGKPVEQTISMRPVYHYLVTMDNANCFTGSDTAWVTAPGGLSGMSVGCDPVALNYLGHSGFNFTYWSNIPEVTFSIKVKRSTGAIVNSTQTKTLTEKQVTPITLTF